MRFSNIRINQGVISSLNISHLQVIDVAISQIQHNGDLALSHVLWEFTQAVLESREVEPDARKDMIERLAFLVDQVLTSQDQKQRPGARAVLADLATTTSAIPGLDSLMKELAPLLQRSLP